MVPGVAVHSRLADGGIMLRMLFWLIMKEFLIPEIYETFWGVNGIIYVR